MQLSLHKIVNINSKYLHDYSKIHNNRKKKLEINVMKYMNDFRALTAFRLKKSSPINTETE